MILDQLLVFSEAQEITFSVPSDNIVDWQDVRDIGMGENLHIGLTIIQAPVSYEETTTVCLKVQAADDAEFTQNLITLDRTGRIPFATLHTGKTLFLRLQRGAARRYLRLYYEIEKGLLSVGQFSAYMVLDVQDAPVYYPSGFTVE